MSNIKIPGGPRVMRQNRRRGRIHISHRLAISDPPTRFTLSIPRACFKDSADTIRAMMGVAQAMVLDLPRRRTGPGLHTIRWRPAGTTRSIASITIERTAIPALRAAITDLAPDATEILGYNLYAASASDYVGMLIQHPPRRGGPAERRLTLALQAALAASHTLVVQAGRDDCLRTAIDQIFKDDPELLAYLEAAIESGWNPEQARVVGLVDRAFRGAWEQAGHPGVVYSGSADVAHYRRAGAMPPAEVRYRDPADVFREYLYGDTPVKGTLATLQRRSAVAFGLLRDDWKRMYLGSPGAAARSLRLL